VKAGFEPAPFEHARWVHCEDAAKLKEFIDANQGSLANDRDGAPVFLARNTWELNYTAEKFPAIRFLKTREQPE
jgi:peptide chain release factor 3